MLKKALKPFLTSSLVLLSIVTWAVTMVKSGWMYGFGLGFWGANGHDGLWHIALSNNFAKFSFQNPVFANSSLKNYHVGFDILLAFIHRITGVEISNLYFQVLPLFFISLIIYLTYTFVSGWTKSKLSGWLSVFFVFFGGSMAWIFNKGESTFWSQQSISTLINPPFALSLIFILLGLISLKNKKFILTIIFFGLLIQIKVYAGILVLGGLFVASLYSIYKKENTFISKYFVGTLLFSILIFLPFNRSPQSIINIQPFWFLETMMSYSDRLGWQRFYSAMTTYKMGHLWIKGVVAYSVAAAIFVIGNFWTRLIFIKDIKKNVDSTKIILLSIILFGLVIPLVFVQQGTPWNTIQFLYYSLFASGILAGVSLGQLKIPKYLPFVLIVLTLPTTYMTLRDVYVPSRPPAMLSTFESEALTFLRDQPDGLVLTYPYDSDKARAAVDNPPRPLYLYESTAYVSAYSNKNVYLEDEVNLNILGYDWQGRKSDVILWYKEPNQLTAKKFLDTNNIKYIYWVKPQRALLGEAQLGLVKIFENKEVIIYRYGSDISGR